MSMLWQVSYAVLSLTCQSIEAFQPNSFLVSGFTLALDHDMPSIQTRLRSVVSRAEPHGISQLSCSMLRKVEVVKGGAG